MRKLILALMLLLPLGMLAAPMASAQKAEQKTRCEVHRQNTDTSVCPPNRNQWQIWSPASGRTGYWSCNNPGIDACSDANQCT